MELQAMMTAMATDWMIELESMCEVTKHTYARRQLDYIRAVEHECQLRAWKEAYRKVSQLCHKLGGELLREFEQTFPQGVDSYLA